MNNYTEIYNKKIFVENLSKIIRNNQKDYHQIYFLTITFKNSHRELKNEAYNAYFKTVYQKINQYSLSRSLIKKKQKSRIIMIAEKSRDCRSKNMIKAYHYHGFVMIPDKADDKFNRNCITQINDDEKTRDSLCDRIIRQERQCVSCDSCDIQHVSNAKNIINVSRYITKNFISKSQREMKFNLSDISKFDKKSSYTYSDYISHKGVSCDDIQIFCATTKTIH